MTAMPDQLPPQRVLVIESGDGWQAFAVPSDWDTDDIDRYLNGRAYGRAGVLTIKSLPIEPNCDWCGEDGHSVGECPDPIAVDGHAGNL